MSKPTMILALGPMAGYTDAPFRKICTTLGANLTITEMVSAMGLLHAPKSGEPYRHLLHTNPNEKNVYAQIFGSDPLVCLQAANIIADMGFFSAIDINMGCPVKKIVGNGEGSALMKNPAQAAKIVETLAKGCILPVSVKMRIGWDADHINAVEFARVLEQSGASLITVHGRTREQFYSGTANWDVIAEVKQAVNIPVIANGDIVNLDSAKAIIERTKCDGIMVGRASMGNPWIFQEIDCFYHNKTFISPTAAERKAMIIEHFQSVVDFVGEHKGLAEAKSQLVHYFFGKVHAGAARRSLNQAGSMEDVLALIDQFFDETL